MLPGVDQNKHPQPRVLIQMVLLLVLFAALSSRPTVDKIETNFLLVLHYYNADKEIYLLLSEQLGLGAKIHPRAGKAVGTAIQDSIDSQPSYLVGNLSDNSRSV